MSITFWKNPIHPTLERKSKDKDKADQEKKKGEPPSKKTKGAPLSISLQFYQFFAVAWVSLLTHHLDILN